MTIQVDNNKVNVFICDDHAENASIRTVKEAYVTRQSQIAALMQQMRDLGMDVSVNTSELAIVQNKPTNTNPVRKQSNNILEQPINPDDDMIPTEVFDNKIKRPIVSVGGTTGMGDIKSHSSIDPRDLTDKLDPALTAGKVSIGIVECRGQQMAFQQKRVDGTGVTIVNINQQVDDKVLQDRFKSMARASMDDKATDFRSGYPTNSIQCPMCRGKGEIRNGKNMIVCPKCKGLCEIIVG